MLVSSVGWKTYRADSCQTASSQMFYSPGDTIVLRGSLQKDLENGLLRIKQFLSDCNQKNCGQ